MADVIEAYQLSVPVIVSHLSEDHTPQTVDTWADAEKRQKDWDDAGLGG